MRRSKFRILFRAVLTLAILLNVSSCSIYYEDVYTIRLKDERHKIFKDRISGNVYYYIVSKCDSLKTTYLINYDKDWGKSNYLIRKTEYQKNKQTICWTSVTDTVPHPKFEELILDTNCEYVFSGISESESAIISLLYLSTSDLSDNSSLKIWKGVIGFVSCKKDS